MIKWIKDHKEDLKGTALVVLFFFLLFLAIDFYIELLFHFHLVKCN